ncbi:hypothetical protein [Marinifilum sp. D737]|uniref:hypothetical protein n=1 Tax=Marinifilum sp. D737 TaxID=2969628 RepID=UPI002272410C|nr:hypothetical protein [Marinifilum sp. D737]MCY1635104.1 hypothetical protein [Marinifilum sp. D737]
MKKLLIVILLFVLCGTIGVQASVLAQTDTSTGNVTEQTTPADQTESKGGGIDWMQVIFAGSYLLGVFVLFPLVVYTNYQEKMLGDENPDKFKIPEDLSEEERNDRAEQVLVGIEEKLTPFTDDEGNEMITITSGAQARYMRHGLNYINTRLCPGDPVVNARVEEFLNVYKDRTTREFTGSKWILGCAIGILVFMGIMDIGILLSSFTLIHIIGITFYYLSSRTAKYALEKRMENFNSRKLGIIGGVMAALFAGFSIKEYVSINGGPWQRDYESEGTSTMILIVAIVMVAFFVGFLVAFFGILNFIINYSTSFINPLKKPEDWYAAKFKEQEVAMVS